MMYVIDKYRHLDIRYFLSKSSDSKSSRVKACYLYLRGMMYVANGQIYEVFI